MSDREELRSILSSEESDPGPHDGERAEEDVVTVAEADEDETHDLSPEALVAESIRQTNEELGLEDEEEADAESDDPAAAEDPADIAALKEKARLWEAHEAAQAEQAVEAQRQEIIARAQRNEQQREAEKQRFSNHYKNEEIRLLDQLDADAAIQPNPEAYKRLHRQAIIDACRREESLKVRGVDAEYNARYEALNAQYEDIDKQRKFNETKPAYADFLFEKLELPTDDAEIRAEVMRAGNNLTGEDALHAMTRRAREIKWMVDRLRAANQTLDQAAREVKAREVKKSQPHPSSATNKPRRAKPVSYDVPASERKKLLAAIL